MKRKLDDEEPKEKEKTQLALAPTPPEPEESKEQMVVAKKQKADGGTELVLKERKAGQQIALAKGITRTSGLFAPNMKLSGHEGHVFSAKFNYSGTQLASAGKDKLIFLWNVYGECKNVAVLKSHTNSILEVAWSYNGEFVYSASADKTAAVFDVEAGERIKKMRDHSSFVNAVCGTRRGDALILTGSDDCQAMLWDIRIRHPLHTYKHDFQVTSVAFSDDASQIFTAGIDNLVHCWDVRKEKMIYSLGGHEDTITGLRLSRDGSYVLTNSMDNTLRSWDVRPFVSGENRAVGLFRGQHHDMEQNLLRCSWSGDGSKVACGSADRFVYIWDVKTMRILYKLPGHTGSVNEVDFHPTEPIISSCSSDKTIFLGEIV